MRRWWTGLWSPVIPRPRVTTIRAIPISAACLVTACDIAGSRGQLGNRTMDRLGRAEDQKTVAVIGCGFSGSLLALKLSAAKAGWNILLVEQSGNLGRGLAYGACAPQHLLNVPDSR